MSKPTQFYIDGAWVDPVESRLLDVINPATEEVAGQISLGGQADVDRAVAAAKAAFPAYSQTTREERLALLEKIAAVYERRAPDLAATVTREMGAPAGLAKHAQAVMGLAHLKQAIEVLKTYEFEELRGTTLLAREPIGVCGFITPWNWPLNQIMCKVAPALAVGCTMVLKPSEVAPLNALIVAEILHEAGVPKGVFNLVNGDGPGVGTALSTHPDIDMMSFTGSTRAGILVARNAADTVKRVSQELGGKSANVVLSDADFAKAAPEALGACFLNSGQSCNAPSRLLVRADQQEQMLEELKKAVEAFPTADPNGKGTVLGPVVSKVQWDKIQGLIHTAIAEGARVVAGGPGLPEGLERGYYVRPTIFADVRPDMTIAREEVFGPVLAVIPYQDEEEAIRIANDSIYGLGGAVQSGNLDNARKVARRIRTGMVCVNGAPLDLAAPFGGYKQSGNGREWGDHGFQEFLEVKAIMGYAQA